MKSSKAILDEIRIAMRQKGVSGPELARHLGYTHNYILNVISGHMPVDKCTPCRLAIEDFLGQPFWSTVAEFHARTTGTASPQPLAHS